MRPANDNRAIAAPAVAGRNAAFALFASAIVLLSIVSGLLIIDSPWTARKRSLDRARSGDLQWVMNTIRQSHRDNGKLPESLDKLDASGAYASKSDPVTDKRYEYTITGQTTFQLCATFDLENSDQQAGYGPFVVHGAGRQCFDLAVGGK